MLKLYLHVSAIFNGVLKICCRSINMAYTYYKAPRRVPPIIIMHGLLGSKKNWNQIGLLIHKRTNPKREVFLVDARNHGESPHIETHTYPDMAEDIKAFFVRHNINSAALLGHSMGGRAMMYFTLTNPDLVEKLIVGDISPGTSASNVNFIEDVLQALCKAELPKNVPESQAQGLVDLQLSKTISDLAFRKFLLQNLKSAGSGKYRWQANVTVLLENYQYNLKEFPKMCQKYCGPTLFVAGSKSDYLRKRDHHLILKLFPNAEFKKIRKAGHLIHIDNPKHFLHVCTDFLDK